ncbi:protein SPO16 homolog isoform X4 [Nerophis ophidion]|uniref:protein SPO16 homolog isoform X4 n=1 Tax=Nerophis ophidion TaxID=159077 RepID=UPI002ADF4069|nr:protein SPO16 homolog isoform X4 [Nerophis ophidion]
MLAQKKTEVVCERRSFQVLWAMEDSVWTTTIIISTSLQSHDTLSMLRAQQHRIRLSDGVERGIFIFPLAGVAFMLVEPQHLPENLEESGLIEQIKKFAQVHRNCFVLLYAPFNGKRETETLSLIQQSFFGSNPRVLPVRNNTEILKGMLTIAKVGPQARQMWATLIVDVFLGRWPRAARECGHL